MGEVHRIGPGRLLPGDVDPDIVQLCENLLEQARRGEIGAIAYAAVRADDQAFKTDWEGGGYYDLSLQAGVSILFHRVTQDMVQHSCPG